MTAVIRSISIVSWGFNNTIKQSNIESRVRSIALRTIFTGCLLYSYTINKTLRLFAGNSKLQWDLKILRVYLLQTWFTWAVFSWKMHTANDSCLAVLLKFHCYLICNCQKKSKQMMMKMMIVTNRNKYEMEIWTPCQKNQRMTSKWETDYSIYTIQSPRFSFPCPHCTLLVISATSANRLQELKFQRLQSSRTISVGLTFALHASSRLCNYSGQATFTHNR